MPQVGQYGVLPTLTKGTGTTDLERTEWLHSAVQKGTAPERGAPTCVTKALLFQIQRLMFQFPSVRGENVLAGVPVLFAHLTQVAQTWVRVCTWSTPHWNSVLQTPRASSTGWCKEQFASCLWHYVWL